MIMPMNLEIRFVRLIESSCQPTESIRFHARPRYIYSGCIISPVRGIHDICFGRAYSFSFGQLGRLAVSTLRGEGDQRH